MIHLSERSRQALFKALELEYNPDNDSVSTPDLENQIHVDEPPVEVFYLSKESLPA